MEVSYFFLCCVLFTTVASFSLQNAVPEHDSDIVDLDVQGQNCECENGKCVTDKQGHTKCVCKPGFAFQDKFTCQPCDCGSLGKCIFVLKQTEGDKVEYQKKCVCDVGKAEKDGTCVDCDCGDNSACDYDFGEKRCFCIEGFSEKDGVCTKCDCGFNGQCEYQNGSKKCVCDEGYLELNGICEECDCGDNGTCSFVNDQKTCQCQPGFSVNNGMCEPCDCGSNSENCELVDGAKQCQCKDRYADRYGTCEECYCGDYTRSCDFNDNQKTCSCVEGYVQKGETCELGCSDQQPCQNGGYCKGGFCFCLNGTRGEFCETIDECSDLCPSERETTCDYDVSSQKAYCKCADSNLRYNPNTKQCIRTCEDDTSCKNQGRCTATGRDKFCDCLEGTAGDFCEEIPVCTGIDCGSDAYCVFNALTKSADCACKESGLYYDSAKRKCRRTCEDHRSCKNQGRCTGTGRDKFCDCLEGTTGDFCEEIPVCTGIDCGSDADCVFNASTKSAGCVCKDLGLYYDSATRKCRKFCEKDKECENGGKCGGKGSNRFCECPPGTQGDRCEIVDDCVSGKIQCNGQGTTCVYDVKKKVATCECKDKDKEYDSLTGKCRRSCDKDKECLNGGRCRYKGSNKFCECLKGTQGDRCEIIDDCASGRIKCRGDRTWCDFDVKSLKAACKCRDRGKVYDARNGRCRRGHNHRNRSSEESSSSDESSEEKKNKKDKHHH